MISSSQLPVLVLNYNGWDDTLANVSRMLPYVRDIWVVDNGSKINRLAEVGALSPTIKTLQLDRNYGWAGGYNRALDLCRRHGHSAAYLLNNDAYLEPGSLEAAASLLLGRADLAAVGSVVISNEGQRVWFDGEYHHSKLPSEIEPGERRARTLNGAGFALSLIAFEQVGPFCEDYFLYHEEADWFWRAHLAGYSLAVSGDSRIHHSREGSDSHGDSLYYRMRNRFLASRRGVQLDGVPEGLAKVTRAHIKEIILLGNSDKLIVAEAFIDGVRGKVGRRSAQQSRALQVVHRTIAIAGTIAHALKQALDRSAEVA